MDRLRAFEVFVSVVGKGGFAKAADALNTSPANVTRYVAELEGYLGTRLLNRTSRRISLTEAGQALFDRGRAILDEVAELEALAGAAAVRPRGRLRINVPVSFGIKHMAPLWPRFMERYPDVLLDVSLIDRVVDIVEEGYDLAIRISRAGSQSHVARRLAVSRNIVCASPSYLARHGHPQVPADLGSAQHRCLIYTQAAMAEEWRLTDREGREHAVRVNGAMLTNNGDTARVAALEGAGIIWQPTFLIGPELRDGRLVPLLPGFRLPDIDVLAVYPSRRHLSAKVRVMVDFLAAAFHGIPPWEQGLYPNDTD
ncbi:LysR family transcriptional regulator [Niveispirillum sp. KHB5.9]|uniref:LysR family transcriptional regulator n=1 Tax=Niveispirillum sp. KHB5.9 TaxID=3400269 RepID=UPI003A8A767A